MIPKFIILFKNGDSYGIHIHIKLSHYIKDVVSYLGIFTIEELKKKYPNTSIKLFNDKQIPKSYKKMLLPEYRKQKIKKLLDEN